LDTEAIHQKLKRSGWALVEQVLPADLLGRLREELEQAYEVCRGVQVRNGVGEGTDGTVHHVVGLGSSFLELLERLPVWAVVERYFGGQYILNSFGGVLTVSGSKTYLGRVHRDIRTFSGELPLMMNMLIMLDEFTEDNGATYLLAGSHLRPDRPGDEWFFAHAVRAVGPAGSVVMFNSNLWHAAGVNRTPGPRRALTLTITPPSLKQQCDYPRLIGYEKAGQLSPRLRQLLGYNARVPSSLEEWYQPPEKRFYQRDQG
jgi:hypothetical protein